MDDSPEEIRRRNEQKAELDRVQRARHGCPCCGTPVDVSLELDRTICANQGCVAALIREAPGEPWGLDPRLPVPDPCSDPTPFKGDLPAL